MGITAVIAPDGTITERAALVRAGSILADVPLSTATTPAVLLGRQIEWLVLGLRASIVLIGAGVLGRTGGTAVVA